MKKHILLDIEALGLRPGSAIIELAAVEFFPETGWVGTGFEAMSEPQAPFTADLETLAWHREKGTWPRPFAEGTLTMRAALIAFEDWIGGIGEVEAFWAWGATYDFPLLTGAYDANDWPPPWKYWEARCARTVWQLAFGDRKHGPRPHRAIEDAKAAAVDLMAAMDALRKSAESSVISDQGRMAEGVDIEAGPSLSGKIRASMISGENRMSISLDPDHARRVGERLIELSGKEVARDR